ncbi:TPA: ATP-binding protein [Enterococcus faecium]|uniref:ATP-binding protein n=4 Tax=Enterococcus faecium TaxID=1352 RepID=UPI000BA0C3D8|nr:ATP-binding protein [Enterococcus faecium]EKQ3344676.1 putative DNA binding domain-containing protein [Enterococcus faecium]EKQ3702560.1 putative DNA binding domain-containing protein [Enterococcus faecium]MBJ1571652.1 putative DNA binding domain-containing protein [Enterococcus faecium]MBJ1628432.1 putative DNA binding domain-containing protein [Enterococcus faecium]MBQ1087196.1 putative DNA binding domain-containing protein [Enterococcus faecium]
MDYEIQKFISEKEDQYFDRKSARIKPRDIIKHIVAFANADGGKLVIGIEDDGTISGFKFQGAIDPDEYVLAINSMTKPNPTFKKEMKSIKNARGEDDILFIIDVEPSISHVIFNSNGDCFLRIGDKSVHQTHDQISKLEYDKGQRMFEDIEILDSTLDDIDESLMDSYKKLKKAEAISTETILTGRGLMRNGHLTNAGMLLFGKNTFLALPNSRIRFLRYDGKRNETGRRLNIVKEFDYEGAIPKLIESITRDVKTQLREFQYLNDDGKFSIIPEYPEFAWFEGIVNALTHRDYSYKGDYVRINMYDDRLEIFSPGALPNIVTLQNMRRTRYARNPRIARTLSEFGWVKELNEGVNRIYDEMQLLFLNEPKYSEPNNNSVLLVLENSITSRHLRERDRLDDYLGEFEVDSLSTSEKMIVSHLFNNEKISVKEASEVLKKGVGYSRKVLKEMLRKKIIQWHGTSTKDPTQYYSLNRVKQSKIE